MEQTNTSILSRFPEYGFKSTSMYNPRILDQKYNRVFLGYVVMCTFLIGIVNLLIYCFHPRLDGNFWNVINCCLLMLASLVFCIIFMIISKRGFIPISSFADYIQTKGKMRFFVKDGKFGLVKWNNFKIFIPAMYDKLMWVHENEVMKAYVNGEEFLIDIHNNKLS